MPCGLVASPCSWLTTMSLLCSASSLGTPSPSQSPKDKYVCLSHSHQKFSLCIDPQVSSLKQILQSISPQRISAMQSNILKVGVVFRCAEYVTNGVLYFSQVYRHLTWYDPPQPYDAFHAVLFQLWQRRHVHRTSLYPLADQEQIR